jgi:protein-S-isoprenylcysteine O-methyltransferase Ste14
VRDAFERIRAFLSSSPRQTFVGFPIAVVLFETVAHRGARVRRRWLPLLVIGYALYDGAGKYRERKAAGTRGFERPPEKLLTDGPYALSRNPMYLGHLVFMAGLVGATRSRLAVILALRQYLRFSERVAIDERRLAEKFDDEYRAYVARVPRWIGWPKR